MPVARVSNLAELGYFEDLLLDAGIEPRLVDDDNFDALHGVWRGSFAIWVRAAEAAVAADLVEGQLESSHCNDADTESPSAGGRTASATRTAPTGPTWLEPNSAGKSVSWSPLVACLLAGGLAYWGGHSLVTALRQPAEASHRSDLSQALETLDRPLASPLDVDGSRVVLRNDREKRSIWLELDLDGDGHADARQQFRDGHLVDSQRH